MGGTLKLPLVEDSDMGRSVEVVSDSHVIYFDVSEMGRDKGFICDECEGIEYDEVEVCPQCGSKNLTAYDEYNEAVASDNWNDVQENIVHRLMAKYKSLNKVKKWMPHPYRETAIILENYHVQISISEYCGCGAACVFVRKDNVEWPELAEHWLEQNIAGIEKIVGQFVTPLHRVGTFSNGYGIFERV